MSSNDLKMRFESQFWRMNCQIFSWLLSSGARGGNGRSEILGGILELLGSVPAGLIEDENGVGARGDLGGDLVKMKLHGFAVAGRQHQGSAGSALRAYRPEHIGGLGALVLDGARSRPLASPAVGELVLLPDPHLVLEPHLYRCARGEPRVDFRHASGKVFLNASMASGSCL